MTPRKKRCKKSEFTAAAVHAPIGAELRKRFARMTDAQLGRMFLYLATGRP